MQSLIYVKPLQDQHLKFDPSQEDAYYETAGQWPWCIRILGKLPAGIKWVWRWVGSIKALRSTPLRQRRARHQ
ncbi:hypothetical protein [Yoonia sp. BS5-3]|uniref:DUF393 domain-containing protein n=1 Tax=Yoonia phaeophyticola TaxID=3137369 RepID=A0ABZ2V424_9RHOB